MKFLFINFLSANHHHPKFSLYFKSCHSFEEILQNAYFPSDITKKEFTVVSETEIELLLFALSY